MKNYTLREARELKLLPSVTSVLSVIDKPELNNWRVEQAIKAALTLPRERQAFDDWIVSVFPNGFDGYSITDLLLRAGAMPPRYVDGEDSFAQRVLADAEAQANKAAEFGTRIHDAIAEYLRPNVDFRASSYDFDPVLVPYLQSFADWANENIEEVHSVEQVVGHPSIGVAGRMDLDCTLKGAGRCVCDMKTQAIREGEAKFWPDWSYQLAAYSMCCLDNLPRRIVSVVIPSNEPGPVSVKVYDDEEHGNAERVFEHVLEIWIALRGRGYDPRKQ